MKTIRFGLLCSLLLASLSAAAVERAVVLVYDASGSMWAPMGNSTRVETARRVLSDFLQQRDTSIPLGVIAYGHNRKSDCNDIEVIAPVQSAQPDLTTRLNTISPQGKTPIAAALELAAEQIPKTAESADIVLITDGLETCNADPCAVARQLAQKGIQLRAHVVGFGISAAETTQLACIADATGGQVINAQTGRDLSRALTQTATPNATQVPQKIGFNLNLTEAEGVSIRVPTIASISATSAEGSTQLLGKTVQRHLQAELPPGNWTFIATTDDGWTGQLQTTLSAGQDYYLPLAPQAAAMQLQAGLGDYQAGVTAVIFYQIQQLPGQGDLALAIMPEQSQSLYDEGVIYSYLNAQVGAFSHTINLPQTPGQYKAVITYTGAFKPMAQMPLTVAIDPPVRLTLPQTHAKPGQALNFTAHGAQNYIDLIEIRQGDTLLQSTWYSDVINKSTGKTYITAPNEKGNYQLVYVRRNTDDSKTDAAHMPFTVDGKPQTGTSSNVNPSTKTNDTPAEKSLTFTLPPDAPDNVTWEALPHPDSPHKDVWAPHATTTTIQATLPTGRWTIIATGLAETEYRADITISETIPDNLTVMIPYHNIAGGDGLPTAQAMIAETAALITTLKTTFIDLQTQQTTAHMLNATKQQVAGFMQKARHQLGDTDYQEIKNLLILMGKPLAQTLAAWQTAEPELLLVEENEQQEDEAIAIDCKTTSGCRYNNTEFSLNLLVPQGWVLSRPYFYKSAGGAKAAQASVLLIRRSDDATISLNYRQASGTCLNTRAGRLCYFTEDKISQKEIDSIVTGIQ